MENFLRSKEYWELIESGYVEPASGVVPTEAQRKKNDEMKLKDLKIKNYPFQAIDRTVLNTILKKDTSKNIWDAMKKKFEGNARVKRSYLQALRREFETLEMRSSEESKDIDDLSIDELQSLLIVHEQKFQRHSGEEQALKVTYEVGRGRGRVECPCNNEANYAKFDEEAEMLLMSYVDLFEAKRQDAWFLDSGCSNHMCGDRTMFNELDEKFRHSVKLGNNPKMDVMGKGSVKLLLNGMNLVVSEVYYIPKLKNNFLSIGQLQEKELAILIKGGSCKIFHPEKGLIIQTNMSVNIMFILLPQTQSSSQAQSDQCFHTKAQELSHLWH
ncbi:uncharacterized protein LOC127103778 [Lathyrus oleraceus]|uniref:uncharacterized protein LOC127103778 n=1 Tax=Pisum sativum TaxID=3888 RepID=UPI0021D3B55D|nr:uncharacterized protein LOC127103778 [Pisum sativum]